MNRRDGMADKSENVDAWIKELESGKCGRPPGERKLVTKARPIFNIKIEVAREATVCLLGSQRSR